MNIRKLFPLLMVLVLIFSFAGCGASSEMSADAAAPNYGMDKELSADVLEDSSSGTKTELPDNRKMIQKVWITAETADMDSVMSSVNAKISELGGYVESQESYNGSSYSGTRRRSSELTVRIPEEKLEQFVEQVNTASNVVSTNRTVDDITLSYVATESRIQALETQQARLLELMAQAETMEDLLTIDSKLTDVRTELEQVTSTLKVYDNQVSYATVYLTVSEVKEYTVVEEPESVWDRMSTGFMDSLKGVGEFFKELAVFIVAGSPYIILLGVIGVVTWLIVRHFTKKNKKKIPAQENKTNNE